MYNIYKYTVLLPSVVGCPHLRVPPGGTMRREGDHLTIVCNKSEGTWYLTCKDNKWIGDYGNCSHGE